MRHAMQISLESIVQREDSYQLFLDSFRNLETQRKYKTTLFRFLNSIPSEILDQGAKLAPLIEKNSEILTRKFVELGRKNSNLAKNVIAAYIKEEKKLVESNQMNPNTLPNHIKPIKVLLDANSVPIHWKSLTKLYPRRKKTQDRAYTKIELQKMLEVSTNITDKVIIEVFSSAGFRLEAWDYLTWKDLTFFKNDDGTYKGAALCVYRGDPEQYWTFITPEACRTLENYREYWKSITGDYPKQDEPLLRSDRYPITRRLNYLGVKRRLEKVVRKIGLRNCKQSGGKRHEVPLDHGFRKYFNTMLRRAKVNYLDKEDMMGHKVGLEEHYERYQEEDFERFPEYQKAIPYLTISNEELLLLKNQKLIQEKTELEKRIPELVKDAVERIKNDLITEGWKLPNSN